MVWCLNCNFKTAFRFSITLSIVVYYISCKYINCTNKMSPTSTGGRYFETESKWIRRISGTVLLSLSLRLSDRFKGFTVIISYFNLLDLHGIVAQLIMIQFKLNFFKTPLNYQFMTLRKSRCEYFNLHVFS